MFRKSPFSFKKPKIRVNMGIYETCSTIELCFKSFFHCRWAMRSRIHTWRKSALMDMFSKWPTGIKHIHCILYKYMQSDEQQALNFHWCHHSRDGIIKLSTNSVIIIVIMISGRIRRTLASQMHRTFSFSTWLRCSFGSMAAKGNINSNWFDSDKCI